MLRKIIKQNGEREKKGFFCWRKNRNKAVKISPLPLTPTGRAAPEENVNKIKRVPKYKLDNEKWSFCGVIGGRLSFFLGGPDFPVKSGN